MSEVIADFQLPIVDWCRCNEATQSFASEKSAIGNLQLEM
jgi:hypothetical protein